MRTPARLIAAAAAAVLAALAMIAGPAMAAGATGDVRADLTATGGTGVELVLTNGADTPAEVPTWLTGANGIDDPLLVVTDAGAPAPYTGMIAKRDVAAPGAMVTIAPHASARWALDVATAYALRASRAYSVRYEVRMPDGVLITSDTVTITANAASSLKSAASGAGAVMSIGYTGCNAGEQSALVAALGAADTYAATAAQYFTANRAGALYQQWFGAYLPARWNAVSSHFAAIHAVTSGTGAAFVCHDAGCTAGTFAFVYPNAPYVVYVCGAFWSAGLTGTDSRAGTLIHEISHFTVVAGTDDHVYGQAGAMALATSTPAQAVSNADNHEYFAENTPATPDNAAAYTLSATSQDLGSQAIGTQVTGALITLTSTGDVPLTLGTVASSAADFTLTTNTCSGATLAPSATCAIGVRFAPTATGSRTGTIGIPGNAIAAPGSIALSGTGTGSVPVVPITPAAPEQAPPVAAPPEAAVEVTPPAAPAVAILKSAASCNGRGACAISGKLPAGATRVTISATRKGGAARGTCTVTKAGRGSARSYRCGIALTAGTWSVTTSAIGPTGTVASSTVTRVVRRAR